MAKTFKAISDQIALADNMEKLIRVNDEIAAFQRDHSKKTAELDNLRKAYQSQAMQVRDALMKAINSAQTEDELNRNIPYIEPDFIHARTLKAAFDEQTKFLACKKTILDASTISELPNEFEVITRPKKRELDLLQKKQKIFLNISQSLETFIQDSDVEPHPFVLRSKPNSIFPDSVLTEMYSAMGDDAQLWQTGFETLMQDQFFVDKLNTKRTELLAAKDKHKAASTITSKLEVPTSSPSSTQSHDPISSSSSTSARSPDALSSPTPAAASSGVVRESPSQAKPSVTFDQAKESFEGRMKTIQEKKALIEKASSTLERDAHEGLQSALDTFDKTYREADVIVQQELAFAKLDLENMELTHNPSIFGEKAIVGTYGNKITSITKEWGQNGQLTKSRRRIAQSISGSNQSATMKQARPAEPIEPPETPRESPSSSSTVMTPILSDKPSTQTKASTSIASTPVSPDEPPPPPLPELKKYIAGRLYSINDINVLGRDTEIIVKKPRLTVKDLFKKLSKNEKEELTVFTQKHNIITSSLETFGISAPTPEDRLKAIDEILDQMDKEPLLSSLATSTIAHHLSKIGSHIASEIIQSISDYCWGKPTAEERPIIREAIRQAATQGILIPSDLGTPLPVSESSADIDLGAGSAVGLAANIKEDYKPVGAPQIPTPITPLAEDIPEDERSDSEIREGVVKDLIETALRELGEVSSAPFTDKVNPRLKYEQINIIQDDNQRMKELTDFLLEIRIHTVETEQDSGFEVKYDADGIEKEISDGVQQIKSSRAARSSTLSSSDSTSQMSMGTGPSEEGPLDAVMVDSPKFPRERSGSSSAYSVLVDEEELPAEPEPVKQSAGFLWWRSWMPFIGKAPAEESQLSIPDENIGYNKATKAQKDYLIQYIQRRNVISEDLEELIIDDPQKPVVSNVIDLLISELSDQEIPAIENFEAEDRAEIRAQASILVNFIYLKRVLDTIEGPIDRSNLASNPKLDNWDRIRLKSINDSPIFSKKLENYCEAHNKKFQATKIGEDKKQRLLENIAQIKLNDTELAAAVANSKKGQICFVEETTVGNFTVDKDAQIDAETAETLFSRKDILDIQEAVNRVIAVTKLKKYISESRKPFTLEELLSNVNDYNGEKVSDLAKQVQGHLSSQLNLEEFRKKYAEIDRNSDKPQFFQLPPGEPALPPLEISAVAPELPSYDRSMVDKHLQGIYTIMKLLENESDPFLIKAGRQAIREHFGIIAPYDLADSRIAPIQDYLNDRPNLNLQAQATALEFETFTNDLINNIRANNTLDNTVCRQHLTKLELIYAQIELLELNSGEVAANYDQLRKYLQTTNATRRGELGKEIAPALPSKEEIYALNSIIFGKENLVSQKYLSDRLSHLGQFDDIRKIIEKEGFPVGINQTDANKLIAFSKSQHKFVADICNNLHVVDKEDLGNSKLAKTRYRHAREIRDALKPPVPDSLFITQIREDLLKTRKLSLLIQLKQYITELESPVTLAKLQSSKETIGDFSLEVGEITKFLSDHNTEIEIFCNSHAEILKQRVPNNTQDPDNKVKSLQAIYTLIPRLPSLQNADPFLYRLAIDVINSNLDNLDFNDPRYTEITAYLANLSDQKTLLALVKSSALLEFDMITKKILTTETLPNKALKKDLDKIHSNLIRLGLSSKTAQESSEERERYDRYADLSTYCTTSNKQKREQLRQKYPKYQSAEPPPPAFGLMGAPDSALMPLDTAETLPPYSPPLYTASVDASQEPDFSVTKTHTPPIPVAPTPTPPARNSRWFGNGSRPQYFGKAKPSIRLGNSFENFPPDTALGVPPYEQLSDCDNALALREFDQSYAALKRELESSSKILHQYPVASDAGHYLFSSKYSTGFNTARSRFMKAYQKLLAAEIETVGNRNQVFASVQRIDYQLADLAQRAGAAKTPGAPTVDTDAEYDSIMSAIPRPPVPVLDNSYPGHRQMVALDDFDNNLKKLYEARHKKADEFDRLPQWRGLYTPEQLKEAKRRYIRNATGPEQKALLASIEVLDRDGTRVKRESQIKTLWQQGGLGGVVLDRTQNYEGQVFTRERYSGDSASYRAPLTPALPSGVAVSSGPSQRKSLVADDATKAVERGLVTGEKYMSTSTFKNGSAVAAVTLELDHHGTVTDMTTDVDHAKLTSEQKDQVALEQLQIILSTHPTSLCIEGEPVEQARRVYEMFKYMQKESPNSFLTRIEILKPIPAGNIQITNSGQELAKKVCKQMIGERQLLSDIESPTQQIETLERLKLANKATRLAKMLTGTPLTKKGIENELVEKQRELKEKHEELNKEREREAKEKAELDAKNTAAGGGPHVPPP